VRYEVSTAFFLLVLYMADTFSCNLITLIFTSIILSRIILLNDTDAVNYM